VASQPKPNKPGRPTLPKGQVKTGAIKVRLRDDELRRVEKAAKAKNQTVSQWIRSMLEATLNG
jgi:hypothetical protein